MERDYFFYAPPEKFVLRLRRETPRFKVYGVKYLSPVVTPFPAVNRVTARLYEPERADRAAVVLHGINAEFTARCIAAHLARRGIAAMQVTLNYSRSRKPRLRVPAGEGVAAAAFREGFRQAVLDTRAAADFLKKRYSRIGICGISLGAMISATAFSVDGRFGAAALVLGGGGMADVIFDSRDVVMMGIRRVLRKKTTKQRLEETWKGIEPLSYAKPDSRVLMINARYDTVVRPEHTLKLWQAFGEPPIRWIRGTHSSVYTHLFFIRSAVVRHFRQTL